MSCSRCGRSTPGNSNWCAPCEALLKADDAAGVIVRTPAEPADNGGGPPPDAGAEETAPWILDPRAVGPFGTLDPDATGPWYPPRPSSNNRSDSDPDATRLGLPPFRAAADAVRRSTAREGAAA